MTVITILLQQCNIIYSQNYNHSTLYVPLNVSVSLSYFSILDLFLLRHSA